MKKNLLTLLLLGFFALHNAFAQSRTITGKVTSADDGQPLPGVSVKIQGTTTGTQTNGQGIYNLSVPASAKSLVFTYIGYLNQTAVIGARTTVNVILVSDSKALGEVVVTGYGTEKKSTLTGSVATITGGEIENLPTQTFDKALQGRAAGVQVTSASGQPGGGVNINIRGVATITGSTAPLYIVDGVQLTSGGLSTVTTQNILAAINPADIESIEILKDAASASIYGSQAGNGVVLITTKSGKKGDTKVRFAAQFGVNKELNPYKLLDANQWYQLQLEGTINYANRTATSASAAIAALNTTYFGTTTAPSNIPSYNWYDAIFRTASTRQYDLSFSGGDEKTKFFISGSYNGTAGTVIGSNYRRGTARANVTTKVANKLTGEMSIDMSAEKSTGPTTSQGFFTNTPFTGALFTPPINKIYNDDGSYNLNIYPYGVNLVQQLNLEQRETGSFQTVSHGSLSYEPVKGLIAKGYAGVQFDDARNYNYRPASIPIYAANNGTGSEGYIRDINWNTSGTLSYTKTIAKNHNLFAFAGVEYKETNTQQLTASAQNFSTPLLTLLSSANTYVSEASTYTGYKLISYFGQLKYDYKGKYLLSGNIRDDGSSRFGTNRKYGIFGGVSAGWRITEESFMKPVEFISDLKLRASYGVTGVQPPGDFSSLNQYAPQGAAGGYNGSGSIRQTVLGNSDLHWEKSAQTNLGLDFGFFKNRISGSIDFYKKHNTELLLNVTLPSSSGFGSITQNVGSVDARGIDFDLNTVNFDIKGFRWSTNFNIAFTRNKVVSLYPTAPVDIYGNQYINTSHNYQVGQALNTLYYIRYAGVNAADGRPMYYDRFGNITYNPNTDTDRQNDGDTNPDFFGGFSNTLSYKGFTFDILFQYQYGNEALLQTAQVLEASGAYTDNQVISQLNNRWTHPGQITDTPRPYNGTAEPGTYDPTNFTSRYIQTASYIRLKQITLTYKLPSKLTKKWHVPGASFFVQGLNLATFTNFRDQDPETTGNTLNSYPNPKTLTGGFTLDF